MRAAHKMLHARLSKCRERQTEWSERFTKGEVGAAAAAQDDYCYKPYEHTHTNRLRGAALAKVKLSFFVSLHLFQIAAKKSQLFYTILQLPASSSCWCVRVCSLASNKSGGVIKTPRRDKRLDFGKFPHHHLLQFSSMHVCGETPAFKSPSSVSLAARLLRLQSPVTFRFVFVRRGVQFPFQPGQREKEASARGESE